MVRTTRAVEWRRRDRHFRVFRRLARHLACEGRVPDVFVDIAPKKIGGTVRRKARARTG